MGPRRTIRLRADALGLLLGLALVAAGCRTVQPLPPDATRVGKVLLLPGVGNLRCELAGMSEMLTTAYPGLSVEVRIWGTPRQDHQNLRDHENHWRVAGDIAAELTAYAREHPDHTIDVVGYSGGGAMALFTVAALPEGVSIDRLVLIAPAISRPFPIESEVMPKVKDFAVLYSSVLDRPVSFGTLLFGTMDRRRQFSAGWCGFWRKVPRLLHVRWSPARIQERHWGGHASYMSLCWQQRNLLPAFGSRMTIERLCEILYR